MDMKTVERWHWPAALGWNREKPAARLEPGDLLLGGADQLAQFSLGKFLRCWDAGAQQAGEGDPVRRLDLPALPAESRIKGFGRTMGGASRRVGDRRPHRIKG